MIRKKEYLHHNDENISFHLKRSLVNRYKTMFVDKLTKKDLKELQYYLKNQFDEDRHINQEFKNKFEVKLRQYFHEEVLKREITSIEALIQRLGPRDLKK